MCRHAKDAAAARVQSSCAPRGFKAKSLFSILCLEGEMGLRARTLYRITWERCGGPCHPRTPHGGQSVLHPVLLIQALDMNVTDGASGSCVPRLLAAHTAELGAGPWAPDGQEDSQSQVQRNFGKADPRPGGSVPGQSPGMCLLGSRRCGHLWAAL